MKIKLTFNLLFIGLMIYSCRPTDSKERATKYYDSCLEPMRPYKDAGEQIMSFTLQAVKSGVRPNGTIRISTKDSLILLDMLNNFQSLTEKTKYRLKTLPPFDLFDLKEPSLLYVDQTSEFIVGSCKEILFPFQGERTSMKQKELELLIDKFTNEALKADKEWRETLRKYLIEFEIPFDE